MTSSGQLTSTVVREATPFLVSPISTEGGLGYETFVLDVFSERGVTMTFVFYCMSHGLCNVYSVSFTEGGGASAISMFLVPRTKAWPIERGVACRRRRGWPMLSLFVQFHKKKFWSTKGGVAYVIAILSVPLKEAWPLQSLCFSGPV